jgi:hypothetical protein
MLPPWACRREVLPAASGLFREALGAVGPLDAVSPDVGKYGGGAILCARTIST